MSDMRIQGNFKPLGASLNLPTPGQAPGQSGEAGKPFGQVLSESLTEVNNLQLKADTAVENLASGKSTNIHETMIAISKADLAFRMTLQVRNKVIEAYQEVMRMNV